MLVNKPQFDPSILKVGQAVRLKKCSHKIQKGEKYNLDKFDTNDNGLIIEVRPLYIVVLLASKQQATIDVDVVASGGVEIIHLIEPKQE